MSNIVNCRSYSYFLHFYVLYFEENGFSNYVQNCLVFAQKPQGILRVKINSKNIFTCELESLLIMDFD
jgi:hypothetical protein